MRRSAFCSFTENWNEWESDHCKIGQQGNATFGKLSIQQNPAILNGQGSGRLFEIVGLKMTNIESLGQRIQEKMTCVGDEMGLS